jgi:uncharacterized protein
MTVHSGGLMTSTVAVQAADRVGEFAAADWDRLAAGNLYLSHAWLDAVETDQVPAVRYLALRSAGSGDLLGATPVNVIDGDWPAAIPAPERLSRPGPEPAPVPADWLPAVSVGARIGYDNDLLVDPDLPPDAQLRVIRELLAAAAELAPNRLAPHLNQRGAGRFAAAGWRLAPTTQSASIMVRGRSFEEYVAGLPRRVAGSVRREARAYAERYPDGVGREPLTACAAELAPLSVSLHRKYGGDADADRQRRFYARVGAALGDRSVVFTCRREGRLVGYALGLEWAGVLHMRSAGFDYDRLQQAFEYFSVGYYEPVRYAAERGLRAVRLGVGTLEAKVRRGAELSTVYSAVSRTGAAG